MNVEYVEEVVVAVFEGKKGEKVKEMDVHWGGSRQTVVLRVPQNLYGKFF